MINTRLAAAIAGATVCALATAEARDLAPSDPPAANADREAMYAHMKAAKEAVPAENLICDAETWQTR